MSVAMAAGWSRTSRRRWLRSIANARRRTPRQACAGSRISAPATATCSTPGPGGSVAATARRPGLPRGDKMFDDALVLAARRGLHRWQPLEGRHARGDLVKGLLVDGVDRHLRAAEKGGIVERADFQDQSRQALRARDEMGAAFGAEFPRHGAFKVAALELLRHSLGVAEAGERHQDKHVGRAAADILAFATMALRLHHRVALGLVAHLAAIASAFQFHGISPCCRCVLLNYSVFQRSGYRFA